MREILFRGKRTDNGEWVEGAYLHLNTGNDYICDGTVWIGTLQPCKNEVLPETVGQYTGLTDKNGNKIFEGDIVKLYDVLSIVDWKKCEWHLKHIEGQPYSCPYFGDKNYKCEVIGNIHDNKELLEGV